MVRLSRLHTGTGDYGSTVLLDGKKVRKSDTRVVLIGKIELTSSLIGLLRSYLVESEIKSEISGTIIEAIDRVQQELFDINAECSVSARGKIPKMMSLIEEDACDRLLVELEEWQEGLGELSSFIMPTGNHPVAVLHVARTVIRTTEPLLVSSVSCSICGANRVNKRSCPGKGNENREKGRLEEIRNKHTELADLYIRPEVSMYINRLSDWMFGLGRRISMITDSEEVLWIPIGKRRTIDWSSHSLGAEVDWSKNPTKSL